MAEYVIEKRVVISDDPTALAESVAARFVNRLAKCTADGALVHVSLTGGSMGSAVLAAAARHPRRDRVDWSRVHFWWSDERFVARDHAERNEKQAREALLDHIDIPARNIHPMAASDGE
ncbi:MAG: 6-phosphogluconolactonase, partial [Microbacterium sp.]